MKKTFTKILAVVLCVVMTLTAAPLGGFVGLELPSLFNFEAEAATYSGKCGDNLKWSLNTSTGVLSVSGKGAMYNYKYYGKVYAPWYSNRSYIKTIKLETGVTTVGDSAFIDCDKISSVSIPENIIAIGANAFDLCDSLVSVFISSKVKSIGGSAFGDGKSLKK